MKIYKFNEEIGWEFSTDEYERSLKNYIVYYTSDRGEECTKSLPTMNIFEFTNKMRGYLSEKEFNSITKIEKE